MMSLPYVTFSTGDTVRHKLLQLDCFVVFAWNDLPGLIYASGSESGLRRLHSKYNKGVPNGYLDKQSSYIGIRSLLTEKCVDNF